MVGLPGNEGYWRTRYDILHQSNRKIWWLEHRQCSFVCQSPGVRLSAGGCWCSCKVTWSGCSRIQDLQLTIRQCQDCKCQSLCKFSGIQRYLREKDESSWMWGPSHHLRDSLDRILSGITWKSPRSSSNVMTRICKRRNAWYRGIDCREFKSACDAGQIATPNSGTRSKDLPLKKLEHLSTSR